MIKRRRWGSCGCDALIQISFGTPGLDVSVFWAVAVSSCYCNTHLGQQLVGAVLLHWLGAAIGGCKGQEGGVFP